MIATYFHILSFKGSPGMVGTKGETGIKGLQVQGITKTLDIAFDMLTRAYPSDELGNLISEATVTFAFRAKATRAYLQR